jgi:hypothetical protein
MVTDIALLQLRIYKHFKNLKHFSKPQESQGTTKDCHYHHGDYHTLATP